MSLAFRLRLENDYFKLDLYSRNYFCEFNHHSFSFDRVFRHFPAWLENFPVGRYVFFFGFESNLNERPKKFPQTIFTVFYFYIHQKIWIFSAHKFNCSKRPLPSMLDGNSFPVLASSACATIQTSNFIKTRRHLAA